MLQQQKVEQERMLQATPEEAEKKKDKLDYVVRLQTELAESSTRIQAIKRMYGE
ncbi:hypothetical protein M422DRAFT_265310 [Sphaerobolus stellatus SS14]|uniref:Uncharacterized protein n=1 Tax=Sphaerobolus stellatus (strain SS14) TaxID=990650 RepID=A0A0C9UU87_SPHS4|nr:hypothetical protein M422DRAFT_265310 [Sphaerobolus stellatus SS14]